MGVRVGFYVCLFLWTLGWYLPVRAVAAQSTEDRIWQWMASANERLEADGLNYRFEKGEYLTYGDAGALGRTVFFNDVGNKQLRDHFVSGDPRRGGRTYITYAVDVLDGAVAGLTSVQTTAAIDRAMTTWNRVQCSSIPIVKVPSPPFDFGIVEFLAGGPATGAAPMPVADIGHTGWLPPGLLPSGVLAVTFTAVFVQGSPAMPTDINNDKKSGYGCERNPIQPERPVPAVEYQRESGRGDRVSA